MTEGGWLPSTLIFLFVSAWSFGANGFSWLVRSKDSKEMDLVRFDTTESNIYIYIYIHICASFRLCCSLFTRNKDVCILEASERTDSEFRRLRK